MLEDLIKIISSALAGTLISAMIAKAYIMKSLRDLETALNMCQELKLKLVELSVKMEVIDHMQTVLQDHDRKISAMGGTTYALRGRYNGNSKE